MVPTRPTRARCGGLDPDRASGPAALRRCGTLRRAASIALAIALVASPVPAADVPLILWTWTFTPPSSVNDNMAAVLGAPDLDGDGYADALAAGEDYRVRALSGHSGNPPTVIWTFGGTDELPVSDKAIALYPDRDGDGKPEVLVATGANDRSVHLVSGTTGVAYWSYDLRNTGCTTLAWIYEAVPVGDLDGDGVSDVAAASGSQCNRVIALSGATGSLLWQFVAADGCRTVGAPGDINGDGVPDVLAGCGTNNLDNRVLLLDGRISPPAGRVIWQHSAARMVASTTPIHDFTGDRVPEVVAGSWDATAFAVDGGSVGTIPNPLWEQSVGGSGAWVTHTLRVPDIDGDCIDDIAAASWTNATRIFSGRTGVALWTQSVGTSAYGSTGAVVPDLDGDMQWDWVAGGQVPGWVTAFSGRTGVKLWEWSAPKNVKSVAWIGDINDDGLEDILVGLQDSATAYAFSGRNTGGCVRPTREVAGVRASRLDATRIELTWSPSTDVCHGRYRVFGVPASVRGVDGCFAQLVDITDQDEDGDPTNELWRGPGMFFGYLVIDQAPSGARGPLGHFRR